MSWFTSRRELARLLREVRTLRGRAEVLEAQLEDERERNRAREETLIDRVLTAAGRYPIPETTSKSRPPQKASPSEQQSNLSAIEEAERDMYVEEAIARGRPAAEGAKLWEFKRRGEAMPYESDMISS